MKIATILFTYHRSYHTEQVLTSLKNNTILPEKLFVFQDGLKSKEDDYEWKKVNNLIKDIDWCETEIIISEYNRGLADSIVSGVNYVLKEYDAVIVIEDDCVLAPSYMKFMVQGLNKYERNPNVYSVSGYCWPIALEKDWYDAFGCGRVSTWGWGTWQDRWEKYSKDVDVLKRLKADQKKSRNLATWGRDLEPMLLGTIAGQYDSWGVYWALNVIENEGICINPYKSLVKHIGRDGTGTNTCRSDMLEDAISHDIVEDFIFPNDVVILESTKKAFLKLFGHYTAVRQKDISKEKVLIYGLGNYFFQNENAINEAYKIVSFIDQRKHGWFAGKKIIKINEVQQYEYDKIIIMIMNIQECINISKKLISQGISYEKIYLGHSFYGCYSDAVEKISVLPDGNLSMTNEGLTVKVRSLDEFNNVYEVFVDQIYHYYMNNNKKDIMIDVGMNVGDAVLYALRNERIEKVYAYEPFRETFLVAQYNLQEYLQNTDRIEIFQYGLSSENSIRKIGFNHNMTCGQSTIVDFREKAYSWYRKAGLVQVGDEDEECIEVRNAAEVFLPIIQKHSECNIILKMDCEGEEYGIIEKLLEEGILSAISFIMLEWHYRGKDSILSWLKACGFSYWCNDKRQDMGLIYAMNMSNQKCL